MVVSGLHGDILVLVCYISGKLLVSVHMAVC